MGAQQNAPVGWPANTCIQRVQQNAKNKAASKRASDGAATEHGKKGGQ